MELSLGWRPASAARFPKKPRPPGRFLRALGLALLTAVSAVPARSADEPGQSCRDGVAYFQKGDLLAATGIFARSSAADPSDLTCRFLLAQCHQAWFERKVLYYEEAVAGYEAVLASLSDSVPAWNPLQEARVLLGRLLVRGGEYGKAIGHLKAFLKLRSDYREREVVWNSLGTAHYYRDEYEEAVKAFEQALKANPSHRPARFNLRSVFTRLSLFDVAMVNRRAGRPDLALKTLEELLALAPRYGPAHLQKAILLGETGRRQEAEEAAQRALALDPGPNEAVALRELVADLLASGGRIQEALAQYRKCLKLFPGYVQVIEKMNALEKQLEATADASPGQPKKPEEPVRREPQAPGVRFPL